MLENPRPTYRVYRWRDQDSGWCIQDPVCQFLLSLKPGQMATGGAHLASACSQCLPVPTFYRAWLACPAPYPNSPAQGLCLLSPAVLPCIIQPFLLPSLYSSYLYPLASWSPTLPFLFSSHGLAQGHVYSELSHMSLPLAMITFVLQ